ncbi:MAG: hypothetical protein AB8G15_13055 [Saprospiraceae bacterium]
MKSTLSTLAALSLLLMMSCSKPQVEETVAQSPQLEGQEIFKTVFFSLGEASAEIPSFKDNVAMLEAASKENPEFMDIYTANVEKYIANIERINPAYFTQLKEAIYAKDFLAIKKAMQLGDLLILPTVIQSNLDEIKNESMKREIQALDLAAVNYQDEAELKDLSSRLLTVLSRYENEYADLDINQGRCFFFAGAVAITFAAVGNFVYAVNVAWTANLNWNRNFSIPLQSSGYDYDHYLGEEIIKEIALVYN